MAALVDSQSLRGAETVGRTSRGYDAGKRVNGRKRHIAVDTCGVLLAVLVTGAGVQDRDVAKPLLSATNTPENPYLLGCKVAASVLFEGLEHAVSPRRGAEDEEEEAEVAVVIRPGGRRCVRVEVQILALHVEDPAPVSPHRHRNAVRRVRKRWPVFLSSRISRRLQSRGDLACVMRR
jgi:hypothetical protein